jgi:hypothetical protein
MSFAIGWTMSEDEWELLQDRAREHAASSDYDRGLEALEELLLGTIRFLRDGKNIKPEPAPRPSVVTPAQKVRWNDRPERTSLNVGFDVSLVDFAWQLTYILRDLGDEAADGTESMFNEADGGLTLGFKKTGDIIAIRSNKPEDRGWMISVPIDEFRLGARQFLTSLCGEMDRRAPDLFAWQTLRPLMPYLVAGSSQP